MAISMENSRVIVYNGKVYKSLALSRKAERIVDLVPVLCASGHEFRHWNRLIPVSSIAVLVSHRYLII